MSLLTNGKKTKSEYLEAYPWRAYLWNLPKVPHPEGRKCGNSVVRGIMMRCENPCCEAPEELHFVKLGDLAQDTYGDGLYRCKRCQSIYINKFYTKDKHKEAASKVNQVYTSDRRREAKIKADITLGEDGRRDMARRGKETQGYDGVLEAARKATETKKSKGYYDSEEWQEHQRQVKETRDKNGTFMKEQEIDGLIRHFGGAHYSINDLTPGGFYFKYEADWCDWNKKAIIEIDTPDHAKKRANYHHEKRAYFESLGFRVLNIPVNRSYKKAEHTMHPGYTFLSLCEEHIEGTLPKEYEIDWSDPWYIGG